MIEKFDRLKSRANKISAKFLVFIAAVEPHGLCGSLG
jgi:hypothetical protein